MNNTSAEAVVEATPESGPISRPSFHHRTGKRGQIRFRALYTAVLNHQTQYWTGKAKSAALQAIARKEDELEAATIKLNAAMDTKGLNRTPDSLRQSRWLEKGSAARSAVGTARYKLWTVKNVVCRPTKATA